MSDATTGTSALKTIISHGIPAVALVLGATACKDEPAYFPNGNDTGGGDSDVGGTEDTGNGGDSDVGGTEDTGTGDDTGNGGDSDVGGTEDTGDTGDTVDDTDDSGDDPEPAESIENLMRRFCTAQLACEQPEAGPADILSCMSGITDYIAYETQTIPDLPQDCYRGYLEMLADYAEAAECLVHPNFYFDNEQVYLDFNYSSPAWHRATRMLLVDCGQVDPEIQELIATVCELVTTCQGASIWQARCEGQTIMGWLGGFTSTELLECYVSHGVCEDRRFDADSCD